jgi:hypothetical protein
MELVDQRDASFSGLAGICRAGDTIRPVDKAIKIGLLVSVFAAALALFQRSENGRYQYSTNGNQGVVLDTRTGEFWTEDGTHFEPRMAPYHCTPSIRG